jgi:hypothetical protein
LSARWHCWRGINEIVLAFRLHELHSRVQAVG